MARLKRASPKESSVSGPNKFPRLQGFRAEAVSRDGNDIFEVPSDDGETQDPAKGSLGTKRVTRGMTRAVQVQVQRIASSKAPEQEVTIGSRSQKRKARDTSPLPPMTSEISRSPSPLLDLPSEISSGSRRNEIEPQMPDQSSEDDGLMDRHGSEESRASAQIVNEGSQTFEDEQEDTQSNDDDTNQPLYGDLLGELDTWNTIQRTTEELEHDVREGNIRNKSKIIRDLLKITNKISQHSKNMLDINDDKENLLNSIRKYLDQLEHQIALITSMKQDSQGHWPAYISAVSRGIYAHAIPGLVEMLDGVFSLCPTAFSDVNDITNLKEITRITVMVILLCQTVRRWKIRPDKGVSIVKPMWSVVLPNLRVILKKFQEELNERRRATKSKRDEVERQRRIKADEKKRLVDERESRRAMEENLRARMREVVRWNGSPIRIPRGSKLTTEHGKDPPLRNQPLTTISWSEEQESEMLRNLSKYAYLPLKERYTMCLNSESLKNLLPIHIQNKAMSNKWYLQSFYMQEKGEVPEWVDSLDAVLTP